MIHLSEREKVQGFSVSNKSACIIGCGGLGCNIAVHMVGAGVGKLILCDFDTVDESNLNRQFLYTKEDIGKVKCEAAKMRLSQFSQNTEIESVNLKIKSSDDLNFSENCDIILLAVDNGKTREIVQKFSDEKKIPLVMVSGDSDTVVPYHENGVFVERAYKDAALPFEIYIKPGGDHHPHGYPDPTPVVNFILKYDR